MTPSQAGTGAELEARLPGPGVAEPSWARSSLLASAALPKPLGERGSPRLQEMSSAFFFTLSPPNAEPLHRRKTPLLGREILYSRGNGECFHLQNPEKRGRLALGAPSPEVCSQQVPPPETWGKKRKRSCRCRRNITLAVQDVPSQEQNCKPIRQKPAEVFAGVKGAQAVSDVSDRAWCAGTEDAIPVQSHLCLTAQQVPSPYLTLSTPVGAIRIQGYRLAHF